MRTDVFIAQSNAVQFNGAGSNYIVQTPAGELYLFYSDWGSDVAYKKSTNGGVSWGAPVIVFTGTVTAISVWYDRWSNISAGLIHVAYQESATDDTLYRTVDTESSDALSTQTVIFAGASTANGGMQSITRAVGGNVYCRTMIDAGAEGGFYRLLNANVPNGAWDAARTINEANATQDQIILLPDFNAADTQDIYAIFWDASANEISRQKYDDSANSWSETSISTNMIDQVATTAYPHFDVATDIANSRHILVAWGGVDTVNADLRCWTIDSTTITEVTAVVVNSGDDQGLCAITLDATTGTWWVYYTGKSDGSETFLTSVNVYCKGSTDEGSTWGPETALTSNVKNVKWLASIPRVLVAMQVPPPVAYLDDITTDEIRLSVRNVHPQAALNIGL